MKGIVKLSKILVGLLFIFSGFVKADDPVGFAIKLQEYFDKDALNLPWLNGFALTFSIIIPIVEMVLGIMIIIGARKKLTLWLLLLTILFFLGSKYITPSFSKMMENAIVTLFTVGCIGFSLYCYNYLPVIDFRPYKPGTDIKKAMQGVPDVLKYYYTLKNKKTGATQEFAQFPPNYQNDWDYVSNRTETIKKGIEPKIK